jgi:dolichol-phosphate mannosyltransferase
MDTNLLVSIVIPIKDEEGNIPILAEEIDRAFASATYTWEVIWVDDGSTDGSLRLLQQLALDRPQHRYLTFSRNAGQSAAFTAGFRAARGRFIATVDGDGQNDPADLPRLVERLQAGDVDMVNGYRQKRRDSLSRKLASRLANGFRNLTTGRTVRDVGCSTRAFRKECATGLPQFKGVHRFLPTLVAMHGYRLAEVPVNHRPRVHGRTKYSINNRLWVGLMDIAGIMWLQRRGFRYQIEKDSLSDRPS